MSTCCDLHGRNCEPPSELCCRECTEAAHPTHTDGSTCSNPDLSGPYPEGNCYCGGPEEIYPHRHGTGYYCRPDGAP